MPCFQGWYKEESNLNLLQPHDILRISTMLEAWGDINVAREFINGQKTRLFRKIQENLDFKLEEIENDFAEDIEFFEKRIAELERENKKLRHKLEQAETIIEVQKKLSQMLGAEEEKS